MITGVRFCPRCPLKNLWAGGGQAVVSAAVSAALPREYAKKIFHIPTASDCAKHEDGMAKSEHRRTLYEIFKTNDY